MTPVRICSFTGRSQSAASASQRAMLWGDIEVMPGATVLFLTVERQVIAVHAHDDGSQHPGCGKTTVLQGMQGGDDCRSPRTRAFINTNTMASPAAVNGMGCRVVER